MEPIPLPPWRSPLARALHRNRGDAASRYLQLATVRPDGRPANRTVVFRGFAVHPAHALQIATDGRSQKCLHLRHQAWGEACWYFAKTREQFRLGGILTLVTASAQEERLQTARHQLWQALSDPARRQFAWPHPGHPLVEGEAPSPPEPDPIQPLPDFCLLLLSPTWVDHLNLRGEPQQRCHFHWVNGGESEGAWTVTAVNP